jgi:hypothetical protein
VCEDAYSRRRASSMGRQGWASDRGRMCAVPFQCIQSQRRTPIRALSTVAVGRELYGAVEYGLMREGCVYMDTSGWGEFHSINSAFRCEYRWWHVGPNTCTLYRLCCCWSVSVTFEHLLTVRGETGLRAPTLVRRCGCLGCRSRGILVSLTSPWYFSRFCPCVIES